MNNVLKLGLILSGLSILMTLIFYFLADATFLFSLKSAGTSLLITSIIVVLLGRKFLRDPEEGRLGYGQAVKKLFIAFFITAVISTVFTIMLYGNNEELKVAWDEYQVEMQESGARFGAKIAGASEAEQEAVVEEIREKMENGEIPLQSFPFSWRQFPMGIINATVLYLLLSLLLALFVREKETQYS